MPYFAAMKNVLSAFLLLLTCYLLPGCTLPDTATNSGDLVSAYVGTYTRNEGWVNGKSAGVYQLDTERKTGQITGQRLIAEIVNPSFVVESADEKYLYVVSELAHDDEPTGFLHVLDINNGYREISRLPTAGQAPCHIETDQTGNFVVASNYVGGNASLYRRQSDGTLVATDRFDVAKDLLPGRSSHLHSAQFAPDNRIVAIADLGFDRVWLFALDATNGKLIPHDQIAVKLADKAGPRHMQWSADGRFLYVINELNSTVNVLGYDRPSDRFTILQTISTLPAGWEGTNSCADLHLHPNGKFLFGSNRGHNSIAGFRIDAGTGLLTAKGQTSTEGETPRNFALSPNGKFLYAANQNSGNVTVFVLNDKSGQLTYTGQSVALGTPVCVEF